MSKNLLMLNKTKLNLNFMLTLICIGEKFLGNFFVLLKGFLKCLNLKNES